MTKQEQYDLLYRQIQGMSDGEPDLIALMANTAVLIQDTFHFWWTGFYRLVGDDLVLGPFQGPIACTRIGRGKGVCGAARDRRATVVVPDVELFPGHIACSAASRSEIVVPLFGADGEVMAVLDIDSEQLNTFDDVDKCALERIAALLSDNHKNANLMNQEQETKEMADVQNVTPAAETTSSEDVLHCPDCGAVVQLHDVFCPVCGNKLDKTQM